MGRSGFLRMAVGAGLMAGALGACGTTKPQAPASTPTTPVATTTAPPAIPSPNPGSLSLEAEPGLWPNAVDSFIGSATTSLDMTMYELNDTRAEGALAADAARGVAVRVLLNADDTGRSDNAAAFSYLSAHGVAVHWAAASAIFHQKTITIDHTTSAVMTGNLTSQYYGTTRDFVVIDSVPIDVDTIESTFGADWTGAPPQTEPTADDLVWSPGATSALIGVIDGAHATLSVENEEMSAEPIEAALEAAAARGVSVHLVMTADSAWDDAFNALTAAGVHVSTYRDADDVLYIHAKAIVADAGLPDARAYVGSQNFSTSSLEYNRELGIITTDPSIIGGLSSTIGSDVADADPYHP